MATLTGQNWEGRLINGDRITHILVVSDGPDQDLEVNDRLEAELTRLEADYSITVPLRVVGGAELTSFPQPRSGPEA